MASVPQQYTVADFIEWNNKSQLVLSPEFQRGSVWTPSAKIFLIDTILNDFPIPQVYFRTRLDASKQTTIREVVDGQQRLRSILDFAAGNLRLTSKAPKFKGLAYNDLAHADQENFLSYRIPVVQLLNASNEDVLEVFARLNSYSVKVTPAELRHAGFSEPVKWAIFDAARDWADLWSKYKVVSVRESVRLKHVSVMAEMFMIIDQGYGDGGEPSIDKYYRSHQTKDEAYFIPIRAKIDKTIQSILENTSDTLANTTFYDSPNFLAFFAAVAYINNDMPESRVTQDLGAFERQGVDWLKASETLSRIAQAFDDDEVDQKEAERRPFGSFVAATKSTTHRVASRRVRFSTLVNAIRHD